LRFNATQSGAPEQFTRFNTAAIEERVRFRLSESLLTREELIPFSRNTLKSSADISTSSTSTPNRAREKESIWSNTRATQVRLAGDWLGSLWGGPEGSRVEAEDNCRFDLNTDTPLKAETEAVTGAEEREGERYPNWKDRGRSSSSHLTDTIENTVCSITPISGFTSSTPPKGGEFVEMTTRLEEWPLAREQLRVKTKDDCWGRLFPTITKLNTWGELGTEEGRDRERGDSETNDKAIESSSTDHHTSPLDGMSTLPNSFSFDDGFIFGPDSASNFTTGDWEARMESWMTFSQLLPSPGDTDDLPLITIWNTAPTAAAEELAVTMMTGERGAEDGEKVRETQESRYEGEVWKHRNSKDRCWGLEVGSMLES
jgi:hypothetical protein